MGGKENTESDSEWQRKTVGITWDKSEAPSCSPIYLASSTPTSAEIELCVIAADGASLSTFAGSPTRPGRLEGKVALVTGGGSGFGLGISQKFAEEGAKVLVLDINEGNASKLRPLGVEFCQGDISVRKDWEKALDVALQKFGKLDIVVNNAEFTEEEYEKLFRVNVKGLFQSSQVIIPYFRKRGEGGVFVNISSSGDPRPRPYGAWY